MGDELRHLRPEDATQHEDGYRDARLAQGDSLFHEGHAQLLDALSLQVQRHRHQPVAIGVGLDDGHHRHAHMRADAAQVERQVVEIDHDAGGTLADGGGHHA